jgi:hypothetical protein
MAMKLAHGPFPEGSQRATDPGAMLDAFSS